MITINNSLLLVIDVQDKLLKLLSNYEETLNKIRILAEAVKLLNIPIIGTEQNPLVFGDTAKNLRKLMKDPPMVKFSFSCFGIEELEQRIKSLNKTHLIISGYEAPICVLQTIQDAIAKGLTVYAVYDAIGAVNKMEKDLAVKRYQKLGATVTSAESVIYEIIKDANTPEFKKALPLIKELRSQSILKNH